MTAPAPLRNDLRLTDHLADPSAASYSFNKNIGSALTYCPRHKTVATLEGLRPLNSISGVSPIR